MIVVTGPNGNVGAELTRALTQQSDLPYRIVSRRPEALRKEFGASTPVARFDYDDRATWDQTLQGVETLFLLFPLPHPVTARQRMAPFATAAVEAGCKHIVYVSVPGADRYSVVPHYTVERHIESLGVPFTFLRPTYFSQNLCRDISTHGVDIAQRDEIFIPAGRGRTSFIDSRDVADAALAIFRDPKPHHNRAYLLTGPEHLTFYEVAELFTQVLGRRIRYAEPSLPAFWLRMARRGVGWDVIFFMTITYTLARSGRNEADSPDLRNLIGRAPRTVREFVNDYRDRWTPQATKATLAWVEQAKGSARWRTGR